MAKKIMGYIKLQLPAGKATPQPPVGPAELEDGEKPEPPQPPVGPAENGEKPEPPQPPVGPAHHHVLPGETTEAETEAVETETTAAEEAE